MRVVERVQVVPDGDPLVQVLQRADLLAQLGGPDEEHRDQEAVVGLEVHEQPQLLEEARVLEELGLVHDDHRVASVAEVAEEEIVQHVEELRLGALGRLHAELVEHLPEEVDGVPPGVREQPDLVALGLQPLDERPRQRGLAAPVLAGEHPAALAVADRVDEADERLLVLRRQVEEPGIRRVVEGRLGELPVGLVHASRVRSVPSRSSPGTRSRKA